MESPFFSACHMEGNTFKSLQSFQSSLSTFCFVRNHSSYNAFKDLARSTVMERSSRRFDITTKSQKLVQFQLVTIEISRLVNSFGSDDDDFVTVQDEFSNGGGQATQQMATAINHNRLWAESWHVLADIYRRKTPM